VGPCFTSILAPSVSHTGEAIVLGMLPGAHIDERNMRYLHLQVADIAGHITSASLVISKCDRNGQAQPSKVSEAAVAEMLGATEKLWGALLPYYFWVSRSYRERPLSLKEAVTEIEGASHPDEFLLVGYEDGGVLSISSSKSNFQIGARTAEWWRP
jgi:hypothetical protein